LIHNQFTLKSV